MSGSISSRPTMDKGNTLHPIESRVKHPDFNHSGRWEGCKADRELRVRFDRDREVKLIWKQRADGTRLTTGTSAAPDPPRHNDAPTLILQNLSNDAGDRNQRRRRDNDRRDRDRRDHGDRGGGGGRGQVHFEKDKGTPCCDTAVRTQYVPPVTSPVHT